MEITRSSKAIQNGKLKERQVERFSSLLDSAVDFDQLIVLEVETLFTTLEDRPHPNVAGQLSNIQHYAKRNAERIGEMKKLLSDVTI